ncbi:hypothetical protein HPB48_007983 [Haemaphysalis longicornis]|uniref:Dendritic cell-specific transmembrane protein-like domain-containing protein n=1 Tax=Haemaphysalis longicornis TaxID=44386 RepID=A0A9J6GK33_HAELO|nr:hypothetical protein HPB48_007983 [Haemaphysalis longicornis]
MPAALLPSILSEAIAPSRHSINGFHRIALQVFGTGAVSNLVRKIFRDFDVEEKLERIASNAHCLPNPVRTSRWFVLQLYLVYLSLITLVFAQLFAARMRRAVCAYFFRKLDIGWFEFVRKMAPRIYRLLQLVGLAQSRCCLVCGDPEDPASYVCPTDVCQCIYCFPCWTEIGVSTLRTHFTYHGPTTVMGTHLAAEIMSSCFRTAGSENTCA